jgi:threonyl-tRNA synthetase
MKLSTRPPEYLGTIAQWDHAEAELRKALDAVGEAYTVNEGDGAFYGPKIDFDVTDAIGRKWQCATIQLDYQLPERFDLTYVGVRQRRPPADRDPPGHFRQLRALHGAADRALRGRLAVVAGPVQVAVLPLSDRHLAYATEVQAELAAAGLRVEVDARIEKIGYKIREAQLQKVPYMLVIGDREVAERAVSVRGRSAGDLGRGRWPSS